MNCIIAVEGAAAPILVRALMELNEFKDWSFTCCSNTEELFNLRGSRPDVIVISRFLPGEKHSKLLKHIEMSFPVSRIVLILGEIDEEAKAYEKLAQCCGLYNIVKGPLPGERPYNLTTALWKDIHRVIEGAGGDRTYDDPFPDDADEYNKNDQGKTLDFQRELIKGPIDTTIPCPKNTTTTSAEETSRKEPKIIQLRRSINDIKLSNKALEQPEYVPEITPPVQVVPAISDNSLAEEKYQNKLPINAWPRLSKYNDQSVSSTTKTRITNFPIESSRGLVIPVVANKGGVGKSSVLVYLAEILSTGGIPTCLVDLDLHDPSVAVHYKIKNVPGIEVLAKRSVNGILIDDLVVEIHDNLHVLPGVMDKNFDPYLEEGKLTQILQHLSSKYPVVLVDTPAQFWAKGNQHLKEAFRLSKLLLAVVDQSPYSEESTRVYGPKIISYGAKVESIRLVLNKFSSKLHSVKDVEKYFNYSFKQKMAKVVWTIPQNWELFVKSAYTGKVPVNMDETLSQSYSLATEIAQMAGCEYKPLSSSEKKGKGLFKGLYEGVCGILKRR